VSEVNSSIIGPLNSRCLLSTTERKVEMPKWPFAVLRSLIWWCECDGSRKNKLLLDVLDAKLLAGINHDIVNWLERGFILQEAITFQACGNVLGCWYTLSSMGH
jgi:hypothetical protein